MISWYNINIDKSDIQRPSMEGIHTTSPHYISSNPAGRTSRVNRSDTSVAETGDAVKKTAESSTSAVEKATGFTASEIAVIDKLKVRDQQVRAHEMAHLAAGGQYVTSGMSFSYQKGPDGIMYAVGGEVGIDLSSEPGNPEATISKMQVVINAALAPFDPSPQDRSVAASASKIMAGARQEIMKARTEKDEETESGETRVNGASLYSEASSPAKGQNIDISA